MARIEKRVLPAGRVTYRARVRRLGGDVSKSFSRKTDALAWAVQTEVQIRRGTFLEGETDRQRTVGEMIDRYLHWVPLNGRLRETRNTTAHLL